jgi:hypothetical protein
LKERRKSIQEEGGKDKRRKTEGKIEGRKERRK